MNGSKRFQLNREDLVKIGTGAAVAVVGALVTWLGTLLADIQDAAEGEVGIDRLGLLAAGAVVAALINTGRKWLADNAPAEPDAE